MIIVRAADALVIAQLDAPFVLLPADGEIRKQIVVVEARLCLVLTE